MTTTATNEQARTIYFPGISDHFQAMAAAYRAHGQHAEALPLTTRESLDLGMQVCRGRECLYFVITLGDLFQRARQPGFDPERAALHVPDLTTKCVFVNFGVRKREILREHGLGAVKIMTPVPGNNFEGLGETHALIGDLSWCGMVAVDLLIQLQQIIRPYELEPGASDAAYQQALARVVAATESGAIDAVTAALEWGARRFAAIPQDRSRLRPRIVLVGEYLLYNPYLNLDLARQIEALGGEVEVNRYYKLFYGLNLGLMERALAADDHTAYAQVAAADNHLRALERRVVEPVKPLFTERQPYAASAEVLRNHVRPHYSPEISNGGVDWAEAMDLVEHGASGVIQLVPFLCLGGIVSAAMGSRVRHDVGGVPWLDVVFDAQGVTNIRTRLEAFIHQAAQFQHGGARARQPHIPLVSGHQPSTPTSLGV
ncbi:MAG: hypothetical protein HGA45_10805 [Chloroflexales bacterium]|nr:hypothetical protein [Chloroflexales bacterium]